MTGFYLSFDTEVVLQVLKVSELQRFEAYDGTKVTLLPFLGLYYCASHVCGGRGHMRFVEIYSYRLERRI